MINLITEVRDNSIHIKALNFKGRQALNVELPKEFFRINTPQSAIKSVQDSIREFSQGNSIPPHEIFLVQYFFDCKAKIYSDIRENFPESFI